MAITLLYYERVPYSMNMHNEHQTTAINNSSLRPTSEPFLELPARGVYHPQRKRRAVFLRKGSNGKLQTLGGLNNNRAPRMTYNEEIFQTELPRVNLADVDALSSNWQNCSATPDDIIKPLVGEMLNRFNSCALVGGAHSSLIQKLGHVVDNHDAVIRVNRLPWGRYREFIGSKTTIYFAGARADSSDRFRRTGYVAQYTNRSVQTFLCKYTNGTCNFQNLIMNSGTLGADSEWTDSYPTWEPGWRPEESSFSISHLSTAVTSAIRLAEKPVIGLDHFQRVSSGIQAVFLAASVCNHIDVYGMASPGTIDSHEISEAHDLDKERIFLLRVAAGYDLRLPSCKHSETDACKMLNKILCSLAARARQRKFVIIRPEVKGSKNLGAAELAHRKKMLAHYLEKPPRNTAWNTSTMQAEYKRMKHSVHDREGRSNRRAKQKSSSS